MTAFVGIDLAWGRRNPSGVCVVTPGGCTVDCDLLAPADIVRLVDALGEDVMVAVDAPLIVEPGRSAESAIARGMGRFGVYAHSSTAALERGYDQGIRLREQLEAAGFSAYPCMSARAGGRHVLEVYPHAAHIVLFGLPRIIRYKLKKGRTAASLDAGLTTYRDNLRELLARTDAGLLDDPSIQGLLSASGFRGRARKHYEDQLDAVTCALVAIEAWEHGVDESEVFGDPATGYIAVPGLARDIRFAPALAAGKPKSGVSDGRGAATGRLG